MAISLHTEGSWVAANATTQVVTLPTHSTGDLLIVRVGMKHATLPGDITCGTAGWARIDQHNNGTTASGNGSGDVQIAAFWKVAASASETNPTITYHASVAATPSAAVATSISPTAGKVFATPLADSGSIAAALNYTATMGSHIAATAGDFLLGFAVTNDNTTLTVPTFTQTGITFAAVVESPAAALSSATSNDIAADGCYRIANSGSSSAAAVFTGTNSVADVGAAMVIRIREEDPPAVTGTGAISVPTGTVSGTGQEVLTATGATSVPSATVAGTGEEVLTATGAVSVPSGTVAGSGDHEEPSGPTGTGAISVPPGEVAGAGAEVFTATGAVAVPPGTVAGTGVEAFSGSGAVSVPSGTVAGSGLEVLTATGAIAVPPGQVSGSGVNIDPVTGTGGVSVPPAVVEGLGSLVLTGSGAILLPAGVVAGAGLHTNEKIGEGAVEVPSGVVDGVGVLGLTATGSVAVPAALIAGAGVHLVALVGSGAISVPSGVVSGSGTGGATPGLQPRAGATVSTGGPGATTGTRSQGATVVVRQEPGGQIG